MKLYRQLIVGCLSLGMGSAWSDLDSFASPGASLNLSDYTFVGENAGDASGAYITGVGDVDGDGLGDILIAANGNSDEGLYAGKTYLLLASTILASADTTINLADADYSFVGENAGDSSGAAGAGFGDVDGDGLSDILIRSVLNDDAGADAGKTYLLLASTILASAGTTINLADADYSFVGENAGDMSGASVGLGDVDGDGLSDILIGADLNDDGGADAGKTYLLLASTILASASTIISLSDADYHFIGGLGDSSGYSVGLGDVDGDDLSDILIGAYSNGDGGSGAGKTCLLLASTILSGTSITIDLADADYNFIGENVGDASGFSIGLGDVDGDSLSDIVIGANRNDDGGSTAGKTYLLLASTILAGAGTEIDLANADYTFIGENAADFSGGAIGLVDVDGDALNDILIGGSYNDEGGAGAGKTYLLLAASILASASTTIDLANADYSFVGENAGDDSGYSVASAGDVDGDGLGDILIGADWNDDGGSWAGKTYLIFSDRDCVPTDVVYVDSLLGSSGASGGEDCPVAAIQEGIDLAGSLAITQVVVRGWFYSEEVNLADDISVEGEIRYFGTNAMPPYLLNTGSVNYVVSGANRAGLKYFVVMGGLDLDGVNEMTVQENCFYRSAKPDGAVVYLHNGASMNHFENNTMYSAADYPTTVVVQVGQNSGYNEFVNNVMHRLYYRSSLIAGYQPTVIRLEQYTYGNEFRNNILYSTLAVSVAATSAVQYTSWRGFSADSMASTTYTIDYNKTGTNNYQVTLGTTCIARTTSPAFSNAAPAGFNYHLAPSSICVNRGDTNTMYNDPDGTRNDMGAYGGPDSLNFAP